MADSHDRRKKLRDPLPIDERGQAKVAKQMALAHPLKGTELTAAAKLPRFERVAKIYSAGVVTGAYRLMVLARESIRREGQEKPLGVGEADAWAGGVPLGLPVPPYAAFLHGGTAETCRRIHSAGVQVGVMLALKHLRLRSAD